MRLHFHSVLHLELHFDQWQLLENACARGKKLECQKKTAACCPPRQGEMMNFVPLLDFWGYWQPGISKKMLKKYWGRSGAESCSNCS